MAETKERPGVERALSQGSMLCRMIREYLDAGLGHEDVFVLLREGGYITDRDRQAIRRYVLGRGR